MVIYGIFIILINLTLTRSVPVTKTCHHDIILTHKVPAVQVTSPGYKDGERYPLDIHCKWNISTTSAKAKISLKFLRFDIEQHHLCEWDIVLIHDGFCDYSQPETKKYRYCGNELPATFISEKNIMCMEFISDQYIRKSGFEAIVKLIENETLSSAVIISSPSSSHDPNPEYSESTGALYKEDTATFPPLSPSSSSLHSLSLFSSSTPSISTSSTTPFSLSTTPTTPVKTTEHKTTIPTLDIRYGVTNNKTFEMCNITSKIISGAEGYLTSPNYGNGQKKYPYNVNCTIRILSTTGTNFELNFLDFDVEYHPSCGWDKLTLYDGSDINAPVLKTACGYNFKETITTSGTSVTLQFITDEYVVRRGFKIKYKLTGGPSIAAAESTVISKTIQETTPNMYSSQDIVTSFGTADTMQTSFTSFETNIYKHNNDTFVSSAHMASSAVSTVTTLSDKSYLPTLKLKAIGGNKDTFEICNHAGVMTTNMEGYITSPGYGAGLSYDLNLRCKLRLTTTSENRIKLTFKTIDLEPHTLCKYDNLSLYNSMDASGQPAKTLCGKKSAGSFESTSASIVLEFVSDHIISRKGFKLQFRVLKGELYSTTQLESVLPYQSSHKATVSSEVGSYSYSRTSTSQFSELNTVLVPVVTQSHTDSFLSTSVPSFNGFLASTKVQTDINISPTYVSPSSIGASISAGDQSTSISTTSSSTLSTSAEITPMLLLESGGHKGQTFDICNSTGTTVTGTGGYITSPGFVDGLNYGLNLKCKLLLKSKHSYKIRLKFTHFDIEYHSSCAYDSFSVYDGITTSSPLLKSCGNQLPGIVNSTGSSIMIEFNSDFIITRKGFKLKFETVYEFNPKLPPIERLVDDFTVDFKSNSVDFLPSTTVSNTIQNSQKMSESATPYLQSSIVITTKIIPESFIDYNSLQQNKIITPSSSINISPIQSELFSSGSAEYSDMHLQSSLSEENNQIIYMCSDNQNVNTNNKMNVFSPKYDKDPVYPLNVECYLQVKSSRGKSLKIHVVDFQLENHPKCKFDKLTIFDGKDDSADVIANICGEKSQDTYITTGPEVYLKFVSDAVVAGRGFHLSINEVNSIIETTHSLESSPTTIEATQKTAQHSYTSLFVHSIDYQTLSKNGKLETEYSSIHDIDLVVPTSVLIRTDKSVDTYSSIKYGYKPSSVFGSISSSLFTISITPNTPYTINKLPLECNGVVLTFTSPSGVVMSPGFEEGVPYPRDATCSWVIVAQKYQTIILEFEDFALESHEQCLWDKVAIHDGSSVNSPLIGSFCGDDLPNPIISTGETLYIRLETDRMVEYRGFKANYTVKSKTPSTCIFGQMTCNDGHCIPEEWACDGEKDCQDGEDEKSCGVCSVDKFRCGNGDCITNVLQCNGIDNCTDGLDEIGCLTIDESDRLKIMYEHIWYPVCGDTWQASLGDAICHHLLKGDSADKTSSSTSNALVLMTVQGDTSKPYNKIHNLFKPSSYCSSQQEVILKCKTKDCGERSSSLSVPYVIGGSRSYLGQWPWVVGIKIGTRFICGGSLISEQWVVTAAHCIESISASPHKARILIGAISRDSPQHQHYRATEIVIHPDNAFIHNADIALIRLQRPVHITDHVRPICVQPSTLSLSVDNAVCYVAGWGVTKMSDYYTTVLPDYLNHVKMKLVHQSKCELAYNSRIKDTMFCAGYQYGRIDTCKGDSGSPFMCKIRSKWVLVGVTSWGETPCGQAGKPGVYTRVQSYRGWIDTVTRPEEPSLSCTFESHALCGYHDLSKANTMWTRRFGGWNRPATDYSTKSQKGHYVYAESSKEIGDQAILTTPTIAAKGDKCVTFSFSFYGESDMVLTIEGITDITNNTSQVLMKLEYTSGDWKITNVNVNEEVKTIIFVAKVTGTRNSGIAIDDISVNPQRCNENDIYQCTFDDKTICNYTQLKDDFTDWDIMLSNTSGHYLRLNGTGKSNGDKARLLSPLLGSSSPRCLQFKFRICNLNSGKISIHRVVEFGTQLIHTGLVWSSQSNINQNNSCSWNEGKANLKSESYSYKVVIESERGQTAGFIDVDDFKVYNGNCF